MKVTCCPWHISQVLLPLTVNYADSLVCHGLDKLEEKVPAIKKSPDELKTAGWDIFEAGLSLITLVRSIGREKLGSIKDYVTWRLFG